MSFYGTIGDIDLVNLDYPSIQPTLDLNFAKTKALDPRITFYRNSLATYTDDKGIIRTVPENVPRFDHDPATGESLGLLIEESRANLITHSENLGEASWSGIRQIVTLNQVVSPDGTANADKIEASETNVSGSAVIKSVTVSSVTYTFSVFAKSATSSFLLLRPQNNSVFTQYAEAYFNLSNGTLGNVTSDGTVFTNASSSIQAFSNGWYRCTVTFTLASSGFAFATRIYVTNAVNSLNVTQGASIYAWGAQLEVGAFPTSYIPTSGSTVTRSADVCYIDGTNFSSWYNPDEGTYFIDFNLKNISTSDIVILSTPVVSGRYPWILYRFAENFWKYYNGSNSVVDISSTLPFSSQNKFSISYSTSQGSCAKDGVLTTSDNANLSVGPGINATYIKIFDGGASNDFRTSGTVKRLAYYPKRLTNTQLQNLTA